MLLLICCCVEQDTDTASTALLDSVSADSALHTVFDEILKIDSGCSETALRARLGDIFDQKAHDLRSTMRRIAELTHELSKTISSEQTKRTASATQTQTLAAESARLKTYAKRVKGDLRELSQGEIQKLVWLAFAVGAEPPLTEDMCLLTPRPEPLKN